MLGFGGLNILLRLCQNHDHAKEKLICHTGTACDVLLLKYCRLLFSTCTLYTSSTCANSIHYYAFAYLLQCVTCDVVFLRRSLVFYACHFRVTTEVLYNYGVYLLRMQYFFFKI